MELKPLAERRSSLLQVEVVGSDHATNKKREEFFVLVLVWMFKTSVLMIWLDYLRPCMLTVISIMSFPSPQIECRMFSPLMALAHCLDFCGFRLAKILLMVYDWAHSTAVMDLLGYYLTNVWADNYRKNHIMVLALFWTYGECAKAMGINVS